jgi:signal peptidase II
MSRKRVVFVAVVLSGVALDLWSKHVAFEALEASALRGEGDIEVVDGFMHLHPMRNSGMAWSLFQNVDRRVWIAIRGVLALVLIGVYWSRSTISWWANLAFAFVIAGAMGNLYDNCFAPEGKVRDFLLFIFWGWSFPVFNVADAMITVGAPVLLFYFAEPKKGSPA